MRESHEASQPTVKIDSSAPSTVTDRLAQRGIAVDVNIGASAPPREPPPRDRLDRYRVCGGLGSGGMGAVLLVEDGDLCRQVAAKVMHPHSQRDPVLLRRFLLEAKVSGQLEHPNIVPVYELGLTSSGELFFTMKRVSGRDLDRLIAEAARRVKREPAGYLAEVHALLSVFLKVCDGVAFAHSRGVIHRDLKPANVMVGEFGEVLVLDWGLAKLLDAEAEDATLSSISLALPQTPPTTSEPLRTLDGAIMGTPNYMPPEQAAGRIAELDARSDIYALGAILFHVLCFRPPYDGANAWMVVMAICEGRIPRPGSVRAGIPWELEAVVARAMATEPADRYQTVAELQRDVERYLAGGLLAAASYSPLQLLRKWARRYRTALAAAAVIVVAGAAMGVVSMASVVSAYHREQRARGDAEAALGTARAEREAADRARQAADRARQTAELAGQAEAEARRATDAERRAALAAKDRAEVAQQAEATARAQEAAAKQRAEVAHGATARTLADALAYKAGVALDQGRLLDAQLLLAEARGQAAESTRVEAVRLGLRSPAVLLERAFGGQDRTVAVVAASANGERWATGDESGRVRLWDARSGTPGPALEAHEHSVEQLAYSRDGRVLMSADSAGALILWDGVRGTRLRVLREAGEPEDATVPGTWMASALSPSGELAAVAAFDARIALVDARTGGRRAWLSGHEAGVYELAFAPDGALLASLDEDYALRVWDLPAGRSRALPADLDGEAVYDVAFAGPTELVALLPGRIEVWDLKSGRLRATLPEPSVILNTVHPIQLGARRGVLASAADGTLRVYDVDSSSLLMAIPAERVDDEAFTPLSAERFLTASRDGELRLWRLRATDMSWRPAGPTAETPGVHACAIAAGGGHAAMAGDGQVALLDLEARRVIASRALDDPVLALAVSGDGGRAAWISERGLFSWIAGGTPARLDGDDDPALAACFGGSELWSGHVSGAVRRWDAGRRAVVERWHPSEHAVEAVAFHAEPPRLAVAWSEAIGVLDPATGLPQRMLAARHHSVAVMAFSPDGRRLAAGGADGVVRLWALDTGLEEAAVAAHREVAALAWTPDGRMFASAGRDGGWVLWEAATGRALRRWREPLGSGTAALIRAGGGLVTAATPGTFTFTGMALPERSAAMRASGLVLEGADLRELRAAELEALER